MPGTELLLPLEPDFEHAVLVMSGSVDVDGAALTPGAMIYLGCARRDLRLASTGGARLLLLGGAPFEEQIVMWWNFVARSNDEIAAARARLDVRRPRSATSRAMTASGCRRPTCRRARSSPAAPRASRRRTRPVASARSTSGRERSNSPIARASSRSSPASDC